MKYTKQDMKKLTRNELYNIAYKDGYRPTRFRMDNSNDQQAKLALNEFQRRDSRKERLFKLGRSHNYFHGMPSLVYGLLPEIKREWILNNEPG